MIDEVPSGPLAGLVVLDLSRVLAGPWASQMLGDLGADVVKVEQPGHGDDTRAWGPPFLPDGSGDAAYYLCANRNKRSIAVDLARPEGAALVRDLAGQADIVLENFRVGGLVKYGLDHGALRAAHPRLICCSITGFGQDGPLSDRGGYDVLVQGMSGLMSVTGRPDDEPGGGPMKVGVPATDLFTGLYAATAILAALHHRDRTGEGQHIDLALLDTQVALLAHQGSNYLNGGVAPRRTGNAHANLAPYRDYATADGRVIVALGNDRHFRAFAALLGAGPLAEDSRFVKMKDRAANRAALDAALAPLIAGWDTAAFLDAMAAAKLPAGPINDVPTALADPQVAHRGLVRRLERADGTPVSVLGYPARLSATPADYRRAPPRAGEDTDEVLAGRLGLDRAAIDRLRAAGVIG